MTSTGYLPPTFSESGTLPSGITFSGGVLSGTPAAGTGGSYSFTITASNGIGTAATQSFTLTVDQVPSITSANSTAFTAGVAGSFTVLTAGYPAATISESGPLPSGVTFSGGVLSGTPTLAGSYPISFTASNGVGSNATQNFTLTVNPGAATHFVIPGGPEPFYTAFGFNIFAYDAEGNLATSYNGTVVFSSSDPGFTNLGPVTLVNGAGTQTGVLRTAGVDTITATDAANTLITGTGSFTVQPGPAMYLLVSAPPSAYAGSHITFTVTAYDLFFNVATGYTGSVTFTSSDPSAQLPASSLVTNGRQTFPAILNTAGSQTISATDATNGLASTSGNISVTIPTLVVTTPSDDTDTPANCTPQATPGTGTDASCSLRDALTFALNTGSGNISFDSTAFATAQTITLSNGTLSVPPNTTITGPTSGSIPAGSYLVTVAGGGPSSNFPVFTILGEPSNVGISNLTITQGNDNSNSAGAIVNNGPATLSLQNCAITGNTSTYGTAGIENLGTLTVTNCIISGNSTTSGSGGGILNGGGRLTVIGSTISGNLAGNAGGGILNGGTLTLTNSTVSGNSSSGGGGILNTGTLTATNSTISGNASTGDPGGGIANANGTLTLANTILSGNTAPVGADLFGSITDNGGNIIGSTSVNLAPLGNYGGSTQTVLPLPGSPAICGGLSSNIPSGVTTDQRGQAFDPNCPSGSVDSGAVQTNYGLAFSTEPPANPFFAQPISPAPVVKLTESGSLAASASSSVTISDSASMLTGTTSANLAAGMASFSNLILSSAVNSDVLTAALALTPSINLTAQSTPFAANNSPAVLTSPTPGSMLTSSSVTFQWTPGSGASEYALSISDISQASYNLYRSPALRNTTSDTVSLPINGETLYVGLCSFINRIWYCNYYTFSTSGSPVLAALLSPAPGSVLATSSATFTWSAGSGNSSYILDIGSSGAGSHDLYTGASTSATSASVTGLPTNGEPIYVRLYSHSNGSWALYNDYVLNPATTAMLTSPTAGTTLAGSNPAFTWTTVAGATGYTLYLGTSLGAGNLLDAHTTATTVTASGLPVNGETIYARLWTNLNGVWRYNDTTFTAAAPATLASPTSGTLAAASQSFTWSPVAGATAYKLTLGSTGAASGNLYQSGWTTATTVTTGRLPVNGETVYATLWTNFNGVITSNEYTFTAQ